MTDYITKYTAFTTAVQHNSGTSLNSLADDVIKETETILDNTTNLYRYADFELDFGASTTLAGGNTNPAVYLYLIPIGFDGTNYADGAFDDATLDTIPEIYMAGTFGFRSKDSDDTAARRALIEMVGIGPTKYKVAVKNDLGVAFPSSGVTLKSRTYSDVVSG
jgi:hypothetical protein